MKNKDLIIAFMPLLILIIISITGLVIIAASPFIAKELEKKNEIVEQYESALDEISITYDDDYYQYDVFVFKTETHYFVPLEDVVLIPDVDNEAYIEITRGGKCKLYFFIKWEVE